MEYFTLNNGVQIPKTGFGVFQVKDPAVCEQAVYDAIATGYRLIDTAASYGNEDAVGRAVKKAIADGLVTREELFITSKLWVTDTNYEGAKKGLERSLNNLGLDFIDMYLLHQAMGDYFGAWRALEEEYKAGKIRAIGVSNFFPAVLVNFCENVEIIPAVNQIEHHPFFQRNQDLEVMKEYGIQAEAWAPFAEGRNNIFRNETLARIGDKYGKSAAQVILRWDLQRGFIAIPKSVHRNRMEQNIDIFDFELTQEEMDSITPMDLGHSEIINHFDPKLVKMLNGRKL